ncbi:hypothetical protein Q0590_24955 [Rhodocytophaga aerolata]|uniref:AMP-binding enzyme C-terminal domain-containing protein n=1 Tax=Rhodocytophaga aerolata TaxID=455078 RepID=A0ABT8RBV3_9BACT|nr:hypothetical protein [Rhodocytophaga aerolata]MDO1449550.1 hypothetical protein [Rhodocytophaga aerolata]
MKRAPIREMHYSFIGLANADSECLLDIFYFDSGAALVIATEIAENPGTTIVNAAEILANEICEKFDIDPMKLVFVERTTPQTRQQSFKEFQKEWMLPDDITEACTLIYFPDKLSGKALRHAQFKYLKTEDMKKFYEATNGK